MPLANSSSKRLTFGSALNGAFRFAPYVFAVVFLVRLVALARLTSSPFLLPSDGDMHFYDDWAKQILHGRFTDHAAFYGLPMYAYLLAFLYKVFGYNPFVPGFLQICLDAGTATLLYKIAAKAFRTSADPKAIDSRANMIGVLAALGWAFFVPAQAYSVILMPTALVVFVFWFLVWEIIKTEHALTPLRCLTYGGPIGITATGIATILFIVPLLVAATLLKPQSARFKRSRRVFRIAAISLLFLGVGAGTSPCWIHNYFVARDPVFLSAHGGINFWLGNNPEATGYPHFPGLHAAQAAMLRDSIDLAQAAVGRNLKRSEVSAYWSAKARAYITSDFGEWIKLMGNKLVNFWSAFEYDDISIIAKLRGSGVILPGLHFGLIAALAIPGTWLSIRPFPAVRWIMAAIILHVAAVLPVFVTERYRLAVVPGLVLLASAGICTFWENCALTHRRKVASYIALLAISAVLVTWPQRDPTLWALKYYNSGVQALDLRQWPMARQQLELAHAYAPGSTEINLALGNLWLQQENLLLAESYYLTVLQVDSGHKSALSNLGLLALDKEEWKSAADYLHAALELDPNDAKSHYLYARAQLGVGNADLALSEIQIALQLRPGQREFEEFLDLVRKRQ